MQKVIIMFCGLLSVVHMCNAQSQSTSILNLSLIEALDIASVRSLDAIAAKNQMRMSHWQFRNYKADLLPALTFEGSLPSLNRLLTQYQKADGTYTFISSSSLSENVVLSLSQNIPFTGGRILVQSQLPRLDELDGTKNTSWLSIPANITFEQPLITSRPLWWATKIEPERYKEAQQQFAVNMEMVAIKTIQYYFNLLLAMVNRDIAEQTLSNATQLYDIAEGKKHLGLISDNDLQQLKLGKLNATAGVVTARHDYDQQMFALRNYLGFNDHVIIEVSIPDEAPNIPITLDEVIELAKVNNPITHNSRRRLLEAQQIIAQARANRGFQANIYASLGFTGSASTLPHSYRDLRNRQVVSLGVRIPILDWGKGKGQIQIAKSQAEVEKKRIQQENQDFEQNIILAVQQYRDQQGLTVIYREADKVAQRRYNTIFETFVMGYISVLDINAAQSEKDQAKRNYINQLYMSWLSFYNLRQITLFDFLTRTNIKYSLSYK